MRTKTIQENLDKDLPFINTQETLKLTKSQVSFSNPKSDSPLALNNQKELDNVRAKILALKSFFMEEIYDLRQEISSVRSQLEQERLHHSRNNDCVEKEKNNNQELKDKLHSCQIENQLLREEIKNKQETILKQNNELLKFSHYFNQNRMEKKDGEYKINEHKEKGNDTERYGNQKITRSNKIPRKKNLVAVNSCQLKRRRKFLS